VSNSHQLSSDVLREQLELEQKNEVIKEKLKKKLGLKGDDVAENDVRLDPNSEKLPLGIDFSGEEHQGRYLDLVRFHHVFVSDVARTFGTSFTDEVKKNGAKRRKDLLESSSKGGKKAAADAADDKKEDSDDDDEETRKKPLEYVAFLHELPNLFDAEKSANLDRQKKFSKVYVDFIEDLCEYLIDFLERSSPLQFAKDCLVKEEIDKEFERLFDAGKLKGWEDKGLAGAGKSDGGGAEVLLDVSVVSNNATVQKAKAAKALQMSMNDDAIKDCLNRAGLKTGGTADERCDRLFQVSELLKKNGQVPSKFVRKGNAKAKDDLLKQQDKAKKVAKIEYRLKCLFEGALRRTLDGTKAQAEKKLTMSRTEIEREHEEDDAFAFSDDDDDENNAEIYNPLKLPMGWDGKPIPYWLYKLHGLNVEFKCEICGNYSYWGRRAYEQHFTQWRHQHGMRCLNIPFSKAFNEVTTIEEARRLHGSLEERKVGKWDSKQDQECEDADGNVYNAKTFAELRSQGLI
jgi:splicing factor 3A subunit 3